MVLHMSIDPPSHLQVSVRDPKAAKARYKVTVHTSDIKFAGTDANVQIELLGEM